MPRRKRSITQTDSYFLHRVSIIFSQSNTTGRWWCCLLYLCNVQMPPLQRYRGSICLFWVVFICLLELGWSNRIFPQPTPMKSRPLFSKEILSTDCFAGRTTTSKHFTSSSLPFHWMDGLSRWLWCDAVSIQKEAPRTLHDGYGSYSETIAAFFTLSLNFAASFFFDLLIFRLSIHLLFSFATASDLDE